MMQMGMCVILLKSGQGIMVADIAAIAAVLVRDAGYWPARQQ